MMKNLSKERKAMSKKEKQKITPRPGLGMQILKVLGIKGCAVATALSSIAAYFFISNAHF